MKRYEWFVAAIAVSFAGTTACAGKADPNGSEEGTTAGALGAADGKGEPSTPGKDGGKGDGCSEKDPTCKDDPGGPQPACFTTSVAGNCKDPAVTLVAANLCQSKNASLSSLTEDAKSGCAVTCCDGVGAAPTEACTWTAIGDGSACIYDGDLKALAATICGAQNGEVQSLYGADDCPNGSRSAKLECCAVPSSPPSKDPPAKN